MFKNIKTWWREWKEKSQARWVAWEADLKRKQQLAQQKKDPWNGPYLHPDLNVEVHTKDEHDSVVKILRMKVKEINAALRDFKNEVKLTPELWSPRKYQLVGRAFRKRIDELNEQTRRKEKAWKIIDELVEASAWMREQRAYANINKEARRREMRRIMKGDLD